MSRPRWLQRLIRRWLCYECASTCRHTVIHQLNAPKIVDGWLAWCVRLPSTRPRRCSDCGDMKCYGYREVKSHNGADQPQPPKT